MFDISAHTFKAPLFESVVQEALRFFVSTPVYSLPPTSRFKGVGVYAIYLLNATPHYQRVANITAERPIYVGKAVPSGWRTARVGDLVSRAELYNRLRQHSNSISQAENLDIEDFQCRFMVLEGVEIDLIASIEASLIRQFKPLWNTVIDGFGNHDPGGGRYEQKRSEWDILHPGRSWAVKMVQLAADVTDILSKIKAYEDNLDT